jgi:putative inorganic carbon (HCO3(-)) transporter
MKIVATWEWLLYIAILPVIAFPSLFDEWVYIFVLVLLPLSWIVRKAQSGHFFPPTPLDWTLVLFSLMILVSLVVTPDFEFSLPKVIRVVYGISILYAAVYFIRNLQNRMKLATALYLVLGIGIAAVGLVDAQWTRKYPILELIIRYLPKNSLSLTGAEVGINTNQFAGVLLLVAPLSVALTVTALVKTIQVGKETDRQTLLILVLGAATALILVSTVVLAQTRGAYLGLGLALVFMVLAVLRWQLLLPVTGLIAVVAGTAIVMQTLADTSRKTTLLDVIPSTLLGPSFIETVESRYEIMARAIYGIQDFPLTGMGLNAFRLVVPILYPMFRSGPDSDVLHAHNQFLQAGLDLGIPGLITYLALWLGAAGLLWQVWRSSSDFWLRSLALGFAGSLLAYFVFGMGNAVPLGSRSGFVFWLLFGLVVGLYNVSAHLPAENAKNQF